MPPYWSVYSRPRLLIHTIISSKYFDLAIAGVIGLNVITMAMEYYMMPPVSRMEKGKNIEVNSFKKYEFSHLIF